jgi:hypothetical protein
MISGEWNSPPTKKKKKLTAAGISDIQITGV